MVKVELSSEVIILFSTSFSGVLLVLQILLALFTSFRYCYVLEMPKIVKSVKENKEKKKKKKNNKVPVVKQPNSEPCCCITIPKHRRMFIWLLTLFSLACWTFFYDFYSVFIVFDQNYAKEDNSFCKESVEYKLKNKFCLRA